MTVDPLTGETWRFSVHENGSYMGEPVKVITRGRVYRLPSDWTYDSWRYYWDGDMMLAVYDDYRNYNSPTPGAEAERVEFALRMADEYGQDTDAMLVRLARRIEGHWDARFIAVNLERGVTFYALSYDGDPDGTWRDEIEAVYHGDIWRIETEVLVDGSWESSDDVCDEYYGEDKAQEGFEKEFPLAEFPAELLISSHQD